MAFDQNTRNRLQRFVTDARRSLEEEFTRQLQNDYGLDPVSGTASPLESLRHINDQQRETARILRDTLAHYCASSDTDTQAGLDRIVREQAFTVLNRLAALRMAEARGLLIESVGNGHQAKGFQLYARLAGTGLGETGDAYRVYLQSVFDEFALDLPGLFDRFSPQGRLFPREAALIQVLALINHGEIEPLWAEDETIGWIYQYFNSKEERKAMRDASQAPRNSRELAVRNQFFTPRYVVEFLVDNTLGRLWFNWTGGQTALRNRCQYLLVKPDEQPEAAKRLRDPRTIKLLDPACGSMHFGLYAFDLFLEIYREAWAWEQTHGPGCLDTETGGSDDLKPLSQTYTDQDAFLHDVPRLIIEHNIYGVDIDPRAAQIASLALWLRAQRAWHEAGVKAKDRPQVGRGHVVAAVAPPAEVDLRKRFMEELDPLDAELLEKTLFLLNGLPELGVLLQVEKELPTLVRKVFGEHGDLFREDDTVKWQNAETRLREALADYARAARSTYQGRLFAQDVLECLRIIDLTREQFDSVVMNPPFGQATNSLNKYYSIFYSTTGTDELAATFYSRAITLLRKGGYVGEISSRTIFYLNSLWEWRKQDIFDRAPIAILADIGSGELDDAVNETAAYVGRKGRSSAEISEFCMIHQASDKQTALNKFSKLNQDIERYSRALDDFRIFEDLPICYWASSSFLKSARGLRKFGDNVAEVQMGLAPRNEFRYSRLWWEISPAHVGIGRKWISYAKGGELSPYFSDVDLVLNAEDDLREIKADLTLKYPYLNGNLDWVLHPENKYFSQGLTFGQRTTFLRVSILPRNCYFSVAGKAIFGEGQTNDSLLQSINTPSAQYLMYLRRERLDMDPQFQEGDVARMPWPEIDLDKQQKLGFLSQECCAAVADVHSFDETNHNYGGFSDLESFKNTKRTAEMIIDRNEQQADAVLAELLGFSDSDRDFIKREIIPKWHRRSIANWYECTPGVDELSFLVGAVVGRWDVRFSMGERPRVDTGDLFLPLPQSSPGMLQNGIGMPAQSSEVENDYPLKVAWRGILVDDQGNPEDIVERIRSAAATIWFESARDFEEEFCHALGEKGLREYFQRPSGFFASHLSRYSKSNRKAPIYWPISTSSGSYTLWLYYPSLTGQTLYTAVNDFIGPKLNQVGQNVTALRAKGTARSRDDEKSFEALQAGEIELIELRDTLLQIAPTYRPNHDDGVQITAAPLWPLFRHKPWQKILKDTWAKLEKGDYDWAHLAMAYWPDRVREKCKTDKSLAIAHDLEHLYVEPEPKAPKTRGRKKGGDA